MGTTTTQMTLAAYLSQIGKTRVSIADALGLHVRTVEKWAKGEICPSDRHASDLARVLGIPRDELTAMLNESQDRYDAKT